MQYDLNVTFNGRALLFDLDGTLVDSIPAVDAAWTKFCVLNGLKPEEVLPLIHGRRAVESLRIVLPDGNEERHNEQLRAIEVEESRNVSAFPGVKQFLSKLTDVPWMIVTSGTRDVAQARLKASGIVSPRGAISGEEVHYGKPDPEPFLLGARRLNFEPHECIAFEDTRAGVLSAKRAGCITLGFGSEIGADCHFKHWDHLTVEVQFPSVLINIEPTL